MTDSTVEDYAVYVTRSSSPRTQELTLQYVERERIKGEPVLDEWPENFMGVNLLVRKLAREARLVSNMETLLAEEVDTFAMLTATEVDVRTKSGRLFSINITEHTVKEH